jgi:hypothetical protein
MAREGVRRAIKMAREGVRRAIKMARLRVAEPTCALASARAWATGAFPLKHQRFVTL